MADWTPGMAGQVPLPYPFYVDIVTKRYFDGVDNKNMTQVLNCFASDAILHEATSDTTHNGRDAIRAMFEKLFLAGSSFRRVACVASVSKSDINSDDCAVLRRSISCPS